MILTETKPLTEITREAIKILRKKTGLVNTLRFITQFTTGYGNYTEEREELFADMSLDDIVYAIKQKRQQSTNLKAII